ncbi:hypothetical protein F4810DRAFT_659081 [Camillea tinctor]|nr:hypothetical protein F4810DRAFT_659081 [Camillea tinctor]
MPIVTFGRGFKVPVVKFDEFLIANHGQETFGGTIQPDESDDISQIIRDQGVDADIRVFRPSRMGFGYPKYLFVCFAWVNVYAWRNVDEYLEKPVPTGFEDFMKSLVPDAAISTFVVFNEEDLWLPDPLYATEQVILAYPYIMSNVFALMINRLPSRLVKSAASQLRIGMNALDIGKRSTEQAPTSTLCQNIEANIYTNFIFSFQWSTEAKRH